MSMRLATANWADPALVEEKYLYRQGDVWLGRSPGDRQLPIGYHDDRHVCLVSGSRAGKGTSSIINNLCLWPGSVVVVDPKGENATVTAPRRGRRSPNCEGMGQAVHILDPFKAAQVDDSYRSRFNPLDALDPDNEETVDEAGRIADAIVVMHEESKDPFWDESARAMVKGLILHVVTDPAYEGRRNLVTLRRLIMRGDWEGVEALRASGETDIAPAQALLWMQVARNPAFDGLVAGIGDMFSDMLLTSPKQFESVLQVANRNTEFIDSPAMQRLLESSDFELSELKTRREGMSLYLCLPQRFMNTHYRWLRMMIALTVTEMEIVRMRPATGFPVLMLLDEFAGLKRMEVIEHAVAQIAGYGVKLFFVLQSLEQLKAVYKDNWETFLSNSGLKVFFSLDDHFSRDYVSKLVGETEVIREARSASESDSESDSSSHTVNRSRTTGRSVSDGTNWSDTDSQSRGINSSQTRSRGGTFGRSWNPAGILGLTEKNTQYSRNRNWSKSRTEGTSQGWSHSHTGGGSHGTSESDSYTEGESLGTTHGTSHSHTTGMSETIHKRALVTPDEIGHLFARIDDAEQFIYPGLALIVISGERTIALRRVNYFEDYQFARLFEPHPDYPSTVRWRELTVRSAALLAYSEYLQKCGMTKPEKTEWLAEVGQIVSTGSPVISFHMFDRIVNVRSPFAGMITRAAAAVSYKGAGYLGLFSLRYRETKDGEVYPFEDLVGLVRDLGAQAEAQIKKAKRSVLIAAALGALLVVGIIATRELGLLAAIGLVGFWAMRKLVEAGKHVRRLQAYPYKLLDPASRDDSWRVVEDLRAEINSANPAQPSSQSTPPAEPEKTGPCAPSAQPGVLPTQVIQPAALAPAPEEVIAAPPAAPTPPAAQEPAAEAAGPAMQEVESAVVETAESSPEFRVSRQGPPRGEGTLSAVPDVQAETVASESSQPEPMPVLETTDKSGTAQAQSPPSPAEAEQAIPPPLQDATTRPAEAAKPESGVADVVPSPRDPRASQTPAANAPADGLLEIPDFPGPLVAVDGPGPTHLYKHASPGVADAPAGGTSEPVRRGGLRWWIAGGAAAVLALVGLVYLSTRPWPLAPGVYQCQAGNQISCKVYQDADGVLRLDERAYIKDDPLFGTLQVKGDEATFEGDAGSSRCGEENRERKIAIVRVGSITPRYASVMLPEELKACNEARDTGHLKYDGRLWRGTFFYKEVYTRSRDLPDGKQQVVGFYTQQQHDDFKIDRNQ
jgi:type IV secretory pathway TraG/TraD family ATPase VirD4